MFESGIKADGDLAVNHGGSQQNGAILGNGCATFLAKFAATLSVKYDKLKKDIEALGREEGVTRSANTLSDSAYALAITRTLAALALEDTTSHGRLIVLKEILAELLDTRELTDDQLALIYTKDVLTLRSKPETEESIEHIR